MIDDRNGGNINNALPPAPAASSRPPVVHGHDGRRVGADAFAVRRQGNAPARPDEQADAEFLFESVERRHDVGGRGMKRLGGPVERMLPRFRTH